MVKRRKWGHSMNYRQWKKNYKKQHGYNPPISEDKRKQAKLMAQQLTVTLPEITEAMKKFVPALFRALAEASETLSKGFASTSRAFESMAETYNTPIRAAGAESEGTE